MKHQLLTIAQAETIRKKINGTLKELHEAFGDHMNECTATAYMLMTEVGGEAFCFGSYTAMQFVTAKCINELTLHVMKAKSITHDEAQKIVISNVQRLILEMRPKKA
jgi:poly(A) polymerase Pap1